MILLLLQEAAGDITQNKLLFSFQGECSAYICTPSMLPQYGSSSVWFADLGQGTMKESFKLTNARLMQSTEIKKQDNKKRLKIGHDMQFV